MVQRIIGLITIIFLSISLCGCATMVGVVVGGATTALWLSGKLSDEVNASYDDTIKASKRALDALKMDIKKETKSDKVTQIISEYTDGSKTWIDIRVVSAKVSKVEIRVGMRGDKVASNKILESIKRYL